METRLEIIDRKPENKNQLNLLTFNIGCLPLLGAINAKFLRPNRERTELIIQRILKWNQQSKDAPDIICFQEALAIETRALLQKKLTIDYPHNTMHLGQRVRGAGLLLFSKYPILEAHYKQFNNIMFGGETLAIKGFIGAKIAIDKNHFITVYDTHLEAGSGILKEQQSLRFGTDSWRRGEQMGRIYHDMQTWSQVPPPSHPEATHMKTFLLGDLNASLNDERRMFSISTGKSNNGYQKGMKKYPGQYELFTLLEPTIPTNFIDIREESKDPKGKKVVVPELLEKAKLDNLFVGTYIPKDITRKNKLHDTPIQTFQAEPKIIDGCFCSHSKENKDEFKIKILSHELNGEGGMSKIALSDHFPVLGQWKPQFFQKNTFDNNNEEVHHESSNSWNRNLF